MALLKIEDFAPNYREQFNEKDIKGMSVYLEKGNEKIGIISDALVDEEGNFRYFVIDLGSWILGKKVLMPVGRSRIDYKAECVYAVGITKQQAENLPKLPDDLTKLDYEHEEQVRGVYRTSSHVASATATSSVTASIPSKPIYNRDTYNYKQEPSLYEMNDQDHQNVKLYQERLIASKKRVKTGEVAVGKHVDTETQRISVPIERERVVVEHVTPADAGKTVDPASVNFGSEATRIEIYEETADIHKEAFVREEVRVSKVVEQETVEAQETIRREEIDINGEGRTIEGETNRLPSNRV